MTRSNEEVEEPRRADFLRHPVWLPNDEDTAYLPVDDVDLDAGYMGRALIRAKLFAGGIEFSGYVVGNLGFHVDGPVMFAACLFVGDQVFWFNVHLRKLVEKKLPELYRLLNTPAFPIVPLRYESDVRIGGRPIAGELNFRS